jgi:nucleotide-binding universal stress UspA family protein
MTIVVGYVPTEPGGAAMTAAVREAKLRHSAVVLVNTAVGNDFSRETYADEKQLDAVREAMAAEGIELTIRQFADADPAAALLKVADEVDAELLVIGLRRRSPVAKLVMGSSAQRILLEATCPVLAVKSGHS